MKFGIGDISERFRNILIDTRTLFFECNFQSEKWFE